MHTLSLSFSSLYPSKQVRIQLQEAGKGAAVNRNPFTIGAQMIKNEGFFSLYRGLSAGLLRQATYTTARMGLFNKFTEMAKEEKVCVGLRLCESYSPRMFVCFTALPQARARQ